MKFPLAKSKVGNDESINQVCCKVCISIEGKEILVATRLEYSLYKHA
jgi:hypothetical protein